MKIVFMGTPDFAVPSLQKLLESHHEVKLVVSAPDKERGRGRDVSATPVKTFALEKGLRVVTPVSLKDEIFIEDLKKIEADLFIVVAFRILPKEVYSLPKFGSFNLHGSLLPKYRGAAPIQWAIINGEMETGVTTFFLEEKVDTGNMILQEKLRIEDDDNFGTIHNKMMMLGADVVLKTVELIEKGNVDLLRQDNSFASPAPKITKEICQINWKNSAENIHNLVRGLSPYPGALFTLNGKNYKLFATKVVNDHPAGTEIEAENARIIQTKNEIFIKCGDKFLQVLELQPEGRKRMSAGDFLRGYSFQ